MTVTSRLCGSFPFTTTNQGLHGFTMVLSIYDDYDYLDYF